MLISNLIGKKKISAPWRKYYTNKEFNFQIPNITIYDQIKKSTKKDPYGIAISYLGKNITYGDFLKKIDIAARGFYDLGVRRGSVVTILLPNIPEVLISLYAINKIGGVCNMTHPLSAEEEIKETILSTKSEYLIIYDALYSKVKGFINNMGLKKVIFVNPADSLGFIKKFFYDLKEQTLKPHNDSLFISFKKFFFISKFKKNFNREKLGRNAPAVILHSGGTSGKPKNVVIQNRAFILGARGEAIVLKKLTKGDSALAIMPNFHGFGLSVLMHTPLALGYTTILVPKFDAKKFDTLLKETKPTCVLGVPTLFEALINSNNEKNLDLSFLKYIISGGDILHKNLEDRVNLYLKNHNSKAVITQGYGLSEALACVTLASDEFNKSGSVGIPIPGNYVKIINTATRKRLGYNEIGEIVIHSKALMMGYLNNEKESNEALQIHDDGHIWLHTGDLGYLDKDGFLFYQGRLKRMIITSGYNVYPAQIEEVIESHPMVLQCTVVGVKHPYKQEVPKAYVVLKDELNGSIIKKELDKITLKTEIREYCLKRLSKYMVPNEIIFRKSLPKTKLGKVDFKALQQDLFEE